MNTAKSGNYSRIIAFFLVAATLFCTFGFAAEGWQLNQNESDSGKVDNSSDESDDNKDDDDKNQSVTDDKADYVLNTNTHKFHLPTCQYVKTIDEANIEYYSGSRQDLIDNDYKPCGKCKP